MAQQPKHGDGNFNLLYKIAGNTYDISQSGGGATGATGISGDVGATGFDGATGATGPMGLVNFQTTRYDGDDIQFEFIAPGTLTESDGPSSVFVFINGVSQEPGSDYQLDIPNNKVVLNAALPTGDKIVITRLILLPSSVTFTAEQIGALTNSSEVDGGSF
jgi:hypothetical protein